MFNRLVLLFVALIVVEIPRATAQTPYMYGQPSTSGNSTPSSSPPSLTTGVDCEGLILEASAIHDLTIQLHRAHLENTQSYILNCAMPIGNLEDPMTDFICDGMAEAEEEMRRQHQSINDALRRVWTAYFPACDPTATTLPYRLGGEINIYTGLLTDPIFIHGRNTPPETAPAPPLAE